MERNKSKNAEKICEKTKTIRIRAALHYEPNRNAKAALSEGERAAFGLQKDTS